MCLQEAHRTDEETSHLFLLPSHQRTHQDMHTPSGCHAPLSSTFSENGNAIALGRGVQRLDMVDKSISHHSTYFRLFFVSGQSRQAPLILE